MRSCRAKVAYRRMNQEANRLQSFDRWPAESSVDTRTLAGSGFYYTGQNREVQCFRCGGKISEWSAVDDITSRHRQLDPHCPFIVNPICSGNIPLSSVRSPSERTGAAEGDPSSPDDVDGNLDDIYKNDAMRLLSFVNWPLSYLSRESLAVAGFYYVGGKPGIPIDKVRCAWCGGELENWLRTDVPIVEHTKFFPNCLYAKYKAEALNETRNISQNCGNETLLQQNMAELGIQPHESAHHTNYCTLESRLQSFENWPEHRAQKPKDLAAAGFFSCGGIDEVRCFYCNGALWNWTPTDDPWIEHAKHLPHCDYINLIKGKEFVDRHRKDCHANANNTPPWVVRDEDVEHYMNSDFATAALQCGLQPERLRRAIRVRLEKTRTPFLSTEALIDAALNEQINETPFPTIDLSSSPPSTSNRNAGPSSTVDDEEIDQVTRMIIDSALSGTRNAVVPNMDRSETVISTSNESQIVATAESASIAPDMEKSISKSNSIKSIDSNLSLEEENRLLKEARTCKVCMDSEVGIVFLPCGHLVTCVECAICLTQCPLCRSGIKGVVKTYLS